MSVEDIVGAEMAGGFKTASRNSQKKAEEEESGDALYTFDEQKLKELRSTTPWMKDPKHFKTVKLSPSAIMKMSMHCQSGVEKGIAKGGNPVEVMGLLIGRPLETKPGTLIVTDAFPLPIEGFETRVVADDQDVVNHMIALGEYLEVTRKERFMGWYHSHPFEVGPNSHCFLSQTDLSTQLQWQRAEDPHGNPFVAIVLDPQRSTLLGTPQLKAFRAYPPEYNSPINNECPDGSISTNEQGRLELWGSCWNRYYELVRGCWRRKRKWQNALVTYRSLTGRYCDYRYCCMIHQTVDFFMSKGSRDVLEKLTQDYLWIRNLQPDSDVTEKLAKLGAQAPNQSEWIKTCDQLGECSAAHAADIALKQIKSRLFP